ncbi:general odorant-binding protein 66 [Uranotaenia lowii]|uniref:general odorant-binding protein 66 n=1 Tax=Uranotaenia lowii TaxID=190385 RepID=UPI0024789E83|nr:general odorant-binding protein 66 [Uranotaenia lowii]
MKVFLVWVCLSTVLHSTLAIQCRDLVHKKEEIMECCKAQDFIFHENLAACEQEHDGKGLKGIQMWPCVMECLFERNGLLNGGLIDTDKLIAKAEALNDDFKDKAVEITKDCVLHMEKQNVTNNDRRACGVSPLKMALCIGRGYIHHCPANKWTSSEVCDKLRSRDCFQI